ncbi:MAG TPA: gamma-glutamylcyclotransferase family protein [Gammaproteobacteria bacterium]
MSRLASSLFCYGTLEFPEIMFRVTGEIFPFESAWISDYARYRVKNQAYPGLVYEPGACTSGTLYHEIKPRHFKRLDAYEGILYSKQEIFIETECGELCCALVYLVPQQKKSVLSSQPWDKEHFERQSYYRFLKREFG